MPSFHPRSISGNSSRGSPPANGCAYQRPDSSPVSSCHQQISAPSGDQAPEITPTGWSVTRRRTPPSRSTTCSCQMPPSVDSYASRSGAPGDQSGEVIMGARKRRSQPGVMLPTVAATGSADDGDQPDEQGGAANHRADQSGPRNEESTPPFGMDPEGGGRAERDRSRECHAPSDAGPHLLRIEDVERLQEDRVEGHDVQPDDHEGDEAHRRLPSTRQPPLADGAYPEPDRRRHRDAEGRHAENGEDQGEPRPPIADRDDRRHRVTISGVAPHSPTNPRRDFPVLALSSGHPA